MCQRVFVLAILLWLPAAVQAKAAAPTTSPVDRSTPEGTLAVLENAVESGDVQAGVDCFTLVDPGDAPRIWRKVEDDVVRSQLRKKLVTRFGERRAARVIRDGGIGHTLIEQYRHDVAGWAIDGDVARVVLNKPAYDLATRMIRKDGLWQIQLQPVIKGRPDSADVDQKLERQAQIPREVLENFDKFETAGAVLAALNRIYQADRPKLEPFDIERAIREIREGLAKNPSPTTQEMFNAELHVIVTWIWYGTKPADIIRHYHAEGDNGSYLRARHARMHAGEELVRAAMKEVDSRASGLDKEFHLINCADDPAMLWLMDWEVSGDKAVGRDDRGRKSDQLWIPPLRRINGQWKIDVSEEMHGGPKESAERMEREAEILAQLSARVNKGEFETLDQLREELRKAGIRGAGKAYGDL